MNTAQLTELLVAVDDILLDYIERLEKHENSGLYHGRAVALAVKVARARLEDYENIQ